jgi:uncharacterized protein (DUF849 family)
MLDEVLDDLDGCIDAGAAGVHLHVRDADGAETLDPHGVNETCRKVRALGAQRRAAVEIGLTTGEWIVPDLFERLAMIRECEEVDCATVNLVENGFESVMEVMLERGIGIDVGLWDRSQVPLLARGGWSDHVFRVSIELDTEEPLVQTGPPGAAAQRVNDALDAIGCTAPRLTHGMTSWTWPLVQDAFQRGHDTRVGFEDSIYLPDGTPARSNAELVRAAVAMRK